MQALLVAGAPTTLGDEAFRVLLGRVDMVIAVDSGVHLVSAFGAVPDVIIGDLDSADRALVDALVGAGSTLVEVAAEKDQTDLELALEWADRRGVDELDVVGVLGGRVDHELAALGDLARHARLQPTVREGSWDVSILSADGRSDLVAADAVDLSIIALLGDAVVSIGGCRYPLDRHVVAPLSGLGVSNVALEGGCPHVTVHSGVIAAMAGRFV